MPELPEVEVVARGLRSHLIGKEFASVQIFRKKMTNFTSAEFKKKLSKQVINEIERLGKMIVFYLKNGNHFLIFHLKMTGQLVYNDKFAGGHTFSGKKQFTRVVFTFTDGTKLDFNDQRLFGYCHLIKPTELANYSKKYGMDPVNSNFSWPNFWSLVQKHPKLNFKSFLLNQKHIAGLGNIYADEVAFQSGINPRRKLNEIQSDQWEKVHRNIRQILNKSIKLNGTTFSSFVTADGKNGNFKKMLQVYGRKDQPCKQCGAKLKRIKLAGRGTVVCERCQV